MTLVCRIWQYISFLTLAHIAIIHKEILCAAHSEDVLSLTPTPILFSVILININIDISSFIPS